MQETFHKYIQAGEQAGRPYRILIPRDAIAGRHGYHGAYSSGASLDYKDFREYQPGDDLRHIDWNAYSRSDHLIIKVFREEVNPHVDLIVDVSRSMALEETFKAKTTLWLAGLIATAAINAKCSMGAWQAANGCFPAINGSTRPIRWTDIDFSYRGTLPESLAVSPPKLKPGGIRILISDLLFPGAPEDIFFKISRGAASLFVIQILAHQDVDPSFNGHIELEDSETGLKRILFFDDHAKKQYQQRLSHHQDNWFAASIKFGAKLISVTARNRVYDELPATLQKEGLLRIG